MSDYDTIPAAFSPPTQLPNGGVFTGYSRHVPALLSGTAAEWDRIILLMIEAAEKQIGKVDLFSDMLALDALATPTDHHFITSDTRVIDAIGPLTTNDTATRCRDLVGVYAVHFSHHALSRGLPNITDHSARENMRGDVMKRWRRQFAVECDDAPLRSYGQRFVPRLAFTGSGVWPGSDSVQLRSKTGAVWSGELNATVTQEVEFVISGLGGDIRGCGDGQTGVLVWIESVDKSVVVSAAALPYEAGGVANGDFVVKVRLPDAGEYRVHVVGHGATQHEAGAHGTEAKILPVAGSPWSLVVNDGVWKRGTPTRISMPVMPCTSEDLAMAGDGRWIECQTAGIPPESCLSDGWVYVTNNCHFSSWSGVRALSTAAAVAASRGGRPVWIVLAGSSIGRGTLHALVDLAGGLGMIENVSKSVVENLFPIPTLDGRRGYGSSAKCWGWYDVQIGACSSPSVCVFVANSRVISLQES